jgi:hypothetical protein
MRSSRIAAVLACSVPLFAALASAQDGTAPAAPPSSATPPAAPPAGSAAPAAPAEAPTPAPSATTAASAAPPASPAPPAAPSSGEAAPAPAAAAPAAAPAPAPTPAPAPAPAPESAPPPAPASAPAADTGPAKTSKKKTPRPETTLGIEADLGIAGRLGSADSAYDNKEQAGPLLGGGLFFAPMKMFDIGVTYQRTQLGTEDSAPTNTLFANTLYRSLNSVWANVRTYPWRSDDVGLFVGLMFGPTWESSHGSVTLPPSALASTVQTYKCSASGGASLALGVTAGADFDLGGGLSFLTRLTGASYHTPGDALTDGNGNICGPGLGSTATLDARVAFAYRFDLGGGVQTQTARVPTQTTASY